MHFLEAGMDNSQPEPLSSDYPLCDSPLSSTLLILAYSLMGSISSIPADIDAVANSISKIARADNPQRLWSASAASASTLRMIIAIQA